ncbi:hypothetical protein DHD05_10600 [Arenibacter sp. N53]|nr:hypothetical protein [Arenibacter sp. N53]
MEDIENAKQSVKIVSPYLSLFLVKKLIDLYFRGIEVQLITMDNIEDFYGDRQKNICQLIIQDRSIDNDAKSLRLKWVNRKRLLYFFLIVMILMLCIMAFITWNRMVLWGGIPLILVWLLIRHYTSKIRNAKIYKYSYRQLFPFKVFTTPEDNSYSHPFVHGKLYLIDDGIAYLGSLNFTGNGTKNNYETRIRITDRNAVKELVVEFDALLHNENQPERYIVEWGRELYEEARY